MEGKKGILGLDNVKLVIVALLILTILSIVAIISVTSIQDSTSSTFNAKPETRSGEGIVLAQSTQTISPVDQGVTSSEVKAYNMTWLDFNKTAEDFVLVTSNVTDSITFWYKNETSDWIFVANSSGTNYTNGVAGNAYQYPVYYNGTDYFLGKTDATTFFNGSIDDFRIYSSKLEANIINLTYLGGRL